MPSRTPSHETVVVTGANGFAAAHVVAQLLHAGYKVIGTVRSASKAAHVESVHGDRDDLVVARVDDITSPDKLITAIQLSLVVEGSKAVIEVARHFKSRGMRRLTHTNSFACIYDAAAGPCPDKTYTAADWSPLVYEDGLTAKIAPEAYRVAKAVAEKTAWEMIKEDQDIELVSLCPAMVFGTFVKGAEPRSINELNASNKIVWDVVSRGETADLPPTKAPVWVDIRDVATAHVLAMAEPKLAGKRLLLAAGVYCNQKIADEARIVCPKYACRIPTGHPGERQAKKHFEVDASEEARLMCIKWRTLQDSLRDLLPQLYVIEERGA